MNKFLRYFSGAAIAALLCVGVSISASADEIPQETTTVTDAVMTTVTSTLPITETEISSTNTTCTTVAMTGVIGTSVSNTALTGTVSAVSTAEITTVTTVTVTCPEITEEITLGWNDLNGKWFYFDGEKFLIGKQQLGEDFYVFADNGALRTGWVTVGSQRYYYDKKTHSPVYGWVDYLGEKYYCTKEQGKLFGMHEIDGKTYIFRENTGIMSTGFTICGNYMYYCRESSGEIIYGDNKKTPILIGENYHLISPKGYVLRGWQTVNGRRYFYDYETGMPVWGWVKYQGYTYYVDKIIGKYKGKRYVGQYPCRFDQNGILCYGVQYFKDEDVTSFYFKDGTRAVNTIVKFNNGKYYFNKDGYMQTGWVNLGGNRHYFSKDGPMSFGLCEIDGNLYYFDKNGNMYKGFLELKGNMHYFDSRGRMVSGWQTIDNKKYYFSTSKKDFGAMFTYRHKIDGEDYLFYSTGELVTSGNQNIVLKAISQLGQEGGKPYWTWWGFEFRIEWCACFVSWCATQCGYTQENQTPKFISCKVGIDWFKDHKQWMGRNYIPKSGDYIFFDWEPDGVADHIGIVDYYEDGYVYTVEGNSNDMVRKKIYEINSENIYGFAAPDFD